MSKIAELLKNEKVEWKKLGEVANCFAGGTPNTRISSYYDGDIPWIRSGEINFNIITKSERNITEEGLKNSSAKLIKPYSVVLAMTGATVGRSGVVEFSTSCNQSIAAIETNEEVLNYKYLYHYISSKYEAVKSLGQGALTSLNLTIIKNIEIPIPPIQTQKEIVEILDKFTNYVTELQAELQARTKQYEYYRDMILSAEYLDKISRRNSQNDEVIVKTALKDIAEYSKRRVPASLLNEKNYVGVENLLKGKLGKINSNYVPKEGNLIAFNIGDILIGNIRPYLRKIWIADLNGGTNGDVLAISLKKDAKYRVEPRFLYQILANESFFEYNVKFSKGAKMPRGDKKKIMEYEFFLPSIRVQKQIVSMLDYFDSVASNISMGLPKEIELRQKQYEYYREQLLDFKK